MAEDEAGQRTEVTNVLFNTIKEILGDNLPKSHIQSLSIHLNVDAPALVECSYYIDPQSCIETTRKYKVFLEEI